MLLITGAPVQFTRSRQVYNGCSRWHNLFILGFTLLVVARSIHSLNIVGYSNDGYHRQHVPHIDCRLNAMKAEGAHDQVHARGHFIAQSTSSNLCTYYPILLDPKRSAPPWLAGNLFLLRSLTVSYR